MAIAVLSLSVVLQCAAAWLAFRLRRDTASRSWYLICIAIGLMAIRRTPTLVRILTGASSAALDPWAETVALCISALMVAGLGMIGPLFRSMAQAAARIRRSEEHFRHRIESAEDIITVVTADGTILYESPAARRLLGYDADRTGVSIFTTKSVSEGSGLGLSVVYGIVKTHGGSIAVDTAPGRGTTMYVYLPRVMEGTDATGRLPAPIPRGSEHVLFVDDEESIADLAQELLESLGHEVTVCRDTHAALRAVREDPLAFDVVITDETMPGMRGTELSAELLRVRPQLPILLSTGYSEGVTEASVRRLGIQGLLRKPHGKGEMAEALAAAIQQT